MPTNGNRNCSSISTRHAYRAHKQIQTKSVMMMMMKMMMVVMVMIYQSNWKSEVRNVQLKRMLHHSLWNDHCMFWKTVFISVAFLWWTKISKLFGDAVGSINAFNLTFKFSTSSAIHWGLCRFCLHYTKNGDESVFCLQNHRQKNEMVSRKQFDRLRL